MLQSWRPKFLIPEGMDAKLYKIDKPISTYNASKHIFNLYRNTLVTDHPSPPEQSHEGLPWYEVEAYVGVLLWGK